MRMGDHRKGVTQSYCTPSAGQIATSSDWVALASTTRREHEVIIGVVKESLSGETRVSATPATVTQLLALGYDVVVDRGAGAASSFPDQAYVEVGATVGDAVVADIVLCVNVPSWEQLDALREGATLVGILSPALNPALVEDLAT